MEPWFQTDFRKFSYEYDLCLYAIGFFRFCVGTVCAFLSSILYVVKTYLDMLVRKP